MNEKKPIIQVENVKMRLGGEWVHAGINLVVEEGEVMAIVGGSGSGKTTLLRQMLHLTIPTAGSIRVFDQELNNATPKELLDIQRRWGVLFQQNALFSSLNLLDNVAFPLREHTDLDDNSINELALLKILMVGLSADAGCKYPAELSGGMQKRAGIARALVLDPELIFLDEPTSGLDPETADGFDELLLNLQSMLGLTIVMVTHDLDSLWKVANRVAFLGEGKVLSVDSMQNMIKNDTPAIQSFFNGVRGQRAKNNHFQEAK